MEAGELFVSVKKASLVSMKFNFPVAAVFLLFFVGARFVAFVSVTNGV